MGTKVLPKGSFSVEVRQKAKTGRGRPRRQVRLYGGVQRWPGTDAGTGVVSIEMEFVLLVSIHENGRFVRIPLSLPQAKLWLSDCLGEVEEALRASGGST